MRVIARAKLLHAWALMVSGASIVSVWSVLAAKVHSLWAGTAVGQVQKRVGEIGACGSDGSAAPRWHEHRPLWGKIRATPQKFRVPLFWQHPSNVAC
jgi:hypothetical protein